MPASSPTPVPGSRPPTVFIAIDQGMAARFFLRTDVLRTLTAAGARVVALVPNPDEPYLVDELAGQGVQLERLRAAREVVQRSRPWWLVHNLRTFALAHPRRSPAFLDYYRGFRAQISRPRPMVARLFDAALWPLWRSRTLRRAVRAMEMRLFTPDLHADLFDRFDPDLVVTNSAGWFLPHALILREASRRGVHTAAVVSAWDNPTNKGYRGADPDHVVAWSERMADQLVLHHDLPRERIVIGGVPHFDHYLRDDGLPSRAQLFSQLGLDPARRLVLFATRSPASYLHNPRVAEALAEAVSEDRLGEPAQLVVRLHPVSFRPGYELPLDDYRALAERHPHVHLDVPTVLSQRLRTDMPASESIRLGALIKHCDVLVNVFSTTALEGLLVDRPVVMVAPDAHRGQGRGRAAKEPPAGPRAFADYEHTRELVTRGAARVARSMPELVELVAEYLAHPERDRTQRLEAAARECGPLDGRSGRRVAEQLLAFVGCRLPTAGPAVSDPRPPGVPVPGGTR
jgi:CDP-Glycerol:Poly(glycerophosphate) glycerophosphotransferase